MPTAKGNLNAGEKKLLGSVIAVAVPLICTAVNKSYNNFKKRWDKKRELKGYVECCEAKITAMKMNDELLDEDRLNLLKKNVDSIFNDNNLTSWKLRRRVEVMIEEVSYLYRLLEKRKAKEKEKESNK